jgi:carbon-monoxide dehydrogenase large subunit
VVAVYTGAELEAAGVHPLPPAHSFPRADGQTINPPLRHALARGTVGFDGEAVAAVVAESDQAARAAADAVVVKLDALAHVVDVPG